MRDVLLGHMSSVLLRPRGPASEILSFLKMSNVQVLKMSKMTQQHFYTIIWSCPQAYFIAVGVIYTPMDA